MWRTEALSPIPKYFTLDFNTTPSSKAIPKPSGRQDTTHLQSNLPAVIRWPLPSLLLRAHHRGFSLDNPLQPNKKSLGGTRELWALPGCSHFASGAWIHCFHRTDRTELEQHLKALFFPTPEFLVSPLWWRLKGVTYFSRQPLLAINISTDSKMKRKKKSAISLLHHFVSRLSESRPALFFTYFAKLLGVKVIIRWCCAETKEQESERH